MLSRLSTDTLREVWRTGLIALLMLLWGCASGPPAPADGDATTIPPQARTLYEQAAAAMAAGDKVDAELRFQEFLLRYPDYPGAHVNLAILHAQAGDDAAAEERIEAALALDAAHPAALNQLGMLRRRQGRFEDAEAAYRQALAADPDYALAHYNLGVLSELYLQRLEQALTHFQRYQELTGEDEEVGRWIIDLERRVAANQRTANVTE
ncbi:MAG: tetratricopeptide repeat protein [Woeseiaceae bacterium]|nr:tetratricopeptide repeat protein [Woeseiaceae bacterium]